MTLSELLRAMKELFTTASCRNSRGSSTVTFFDSHNGAPLGAGDFGASDLKGREIFEARGRLLLARA